MARFSGNRRVMRYWLVAAAVVVLSPFTARAQLSKLVLINDQPTADAVRTLGCVPGVGNGAGNAAKINTYLASRPSYALFIPGDLEIDDTLVVPNASGGFNLVGNGPGADIPAMAGNQRNPVVGRPSRLIWAGPPGKPMIEWNARHGSIRGIQFQGRRLPAGPTAVKARVGVHVRTYNQTHVPTGKLRIEDCSFYHVANGLLFGYDVDSPFSQPEGNQKGIQWAQNADESYWNTLWFYYEYNAGAGAGVVTDRTSDTACTLTLDRRQAGISAGAWVDVAWSGGRRTGMICTAVGDSVPGNGDQRSIRLTGGSGSDLPGKTTAVRAKEERSCFVFRTHQALAFGGGKIVVSGHPHEVFHFQRGSKLFQQYVSINGWSGAKAAKAPCHVLRLGPVSAGYYDIGVDFDATCNNVRLLQMDDFIWSNRCQVSFRGIVENTGGPVDAHAVPLVNAKGACQVAVRDFSYLRAGDICLAGYGGFGPPGGGGYRKGVANCLLDNCTLIGCDRGRDVLGKSSGLYRLTMTHCQAVVGESNTSGTAALPIEDGELSGNGAGGAIKKLPFDGP